MPYAALLLRTGNFAGHLADLGVAPGDTVAIFLPNSVAWVESLLAVARAGAISVPISCESTETEISYRLADVGCTAVITTAERADVVARFKASAANLVTLIATDRGTCSTAILRYEDLVTAPARSAYKVPQIVQTIAEIPRTGSGKSFAISCANY